MAISSETARVQYTLAGANETLSVPFYFTANAELLVVKTTAADVDSTLGLGVGYTVAGAGNGGGGSITMIGGAAGERVTITRNVPKTQSAAVGYAQPFNPANFTVWLDRLVMQIQQMNEEQKRALRLSVSSDALATLSKDQIKGKALVFDGAGGVGFINWLSVLWAEYSRTRVFNNTNSEFSHQFCTADGKLLLGLRPNGSMSQRFLDFIPDYQNAVATSKQAYNSADGANSHVFATKDGRMLLALRPNGTAVGPVIDWILEQMPTQVVGSSPGFYTFGKVFFHGTSTFAHGPITGSPGANASASYNVVARLLRLTDNGIPFGVYAQSGQQLSGTSGQIAMAPGFVDVHSDPNVENLLIYQGLINDVNAVSVGGEAAIVTNLVTYLTARRAGYWQKILIVIPPYPKWGYGSSHDVKMINLVALLLADARFHDGTLAHGFIRLDAEAMFKRSSDQVYYQSDGIHFNDAGQLETGKIIAQAIQALMLGVLSPIKIQFTAPAANVLISGATTVTVTVTSDRPVILDFLFGMPEWNSGSDGNSFVVTRLANGPSGAPYTVTIPQSAFPTTAKPANSISKTILCIARDDVGNRGFASLNIQT